VGRTCAAGSDQNGPFSNMFDTPLLSRCRVGSNSRRKNMPGATQALRDKMRAHKLDVVIVPGGPSHWSFGGGHDVAHRPLEWHAISSYVVVPLDAPPTLIFSMGRHPPLRPCAARSSRRFPMCVRAAAGRYGGGDGRTHQGTRPSRRRGSALVEIDPRHKDYMPVNQYNDLRDGLPDADIVFTRQLHSRTRPVIKSEARA